MINVVPSKVVVVTDILLPLLLTDDLKAGVHDGVRGVGL